MPRRRSTRLSLFALPIACIAASPAAAQAGPVPSEIAAQLGKLRKIWPEVAPAEMHAGTRFEFARGKIRIGETTLYDIANTPENIGGVILAFLIGHEAWHSVQAARLSPEDIARMRQNGMLECEADFMGAAAARRHLGSSRGKAELEDAHEGLIRWLTAKAELAGPDSAYTDPYYRGDTIMLGWGQAKAPGMIRYIGRQPPENEAERASETCRKIAGIHDGSLGAVTISWEMRSIRRYGPRKTDATVAVVAVNRSSRPVVTGFQIWSLLILERFFGSSRRKNDLAYDILDVTLELHPKQRVEQSFKINTLLDENGDATWLPAPGGSGLRNRMMTARYADTEPQDYCTDRIRQSGSTKDRALLARIAAVATTAIDDFDAVRKGPGFEQETGFTYPLNPALALGPDDIITNEGGSSSVEMRLRRPPGGDKEAIAIYDRLKKEIQEICGSTRIVDLTPGETPKDPTFEIPRFAPKATLRIQLILEGERQMGWSQFKDQIVVTITRAPNS